MCFLLLQLIAAQRVTVCVTGTTHTSCSQTMAQNEIMGFIATLPANESVEIYAVPDMKFALDYEQVKDRSLKFIEPSSKQLEFAIDGLTIKAAEMKITCTEQETTLAITQGTGADVAVSNLTGVWPRFSIKSTVALATKFAAGSYPLDVSSSAILTITTDGPLTITGTVSMFGAVDVENVIATTAAVLTPIYITNLQLYGHVTLDSPLVELTVKFISSLVPEKFAIRNEEFPVRFAMTKEGIAALKIEKKWLSPWVPKKEEDEPEWDDKYESKDLTSDYQKPVTKAKKMDSWWGDLEDVKIVLVNKVECAADAKFCYVTDAETEALTSQRWTIVTGPSDCMEFRHFEYELLLSNATARTPFGFDAKNHIFDIEATGMVFEVDTFTLTVFAKNKPSEHPVRVCYGKNSKCNAKEVQFKITTEQELTELGSVIPQELSTVYLSLKSPVPDNYVLDFNIFGNAVKTLRVEGDEDAKVKLEITPKSGLETLKLVYLELLKSVTLDAAQVTLLDVKTANGAAITLGEKTILKCNKYMYDRLKLDHVYGLILLGIEDYHYLGIDSEKWAFAKKQGAQYAIEVPYNAIGAGGFAFELGDEIEEEEEEEGVEDSKKLLAETQKKSWWEDWDDAESIYIEPLASNVRSLKIYCSDDASMIYLPEKWDTTTIDGNFVIDHAQNRLRVKSLGEKIICDTIGTGMVTYIVHLKVEDGDPVVDPVLSLKNAEYYFQVNYPGEVLIKLDETDIAGNCSVFIKNIAAGGTAVLEVKEFNYSNGAIFRFNDIRIKGDGVISADSSIVPDVLQVTGIDFKKKARIDMRWHRGSVATIDLGREYQRPKKIYIKHDDYVTDGLTAENYNKIWLSEKNKNGKLIIRGVNLDCDDWKKRMKFDSDIKAFDKRGPFVLECKEVNEADTAARLLAGETEYGIYMRLERPLTEDDMGKSINVGAIVGGVIGGVAFVAVCVGVGMYGMKKRKTGEYGSMESGSNLGRPLAA